MKNTSLSTYLAAVVVALAIMNYLVWSIGGSAKMAKSIIFTGGFVVGMLAMYIAVHIYRHR